jgi:hypothetical protein
MPYRKKCSCKAELVGTAAVIDFCPVHKHAKEMLVCLIDVQKHFKQVREQFGMGFGRVEDDVAKLIKQAGG